MIISLRDQGVLSLVGLKNAFRSSMQPKIRRLAIWRLKIRFFSSCRNIVRLLNKDRSVTIYWSLSGEAKTEPSMEVRTSL